MSSFNDLRSANVARQKEWDPNDSITLAFRGNELAGETGEACNVIKKIERERIGLSGERASRQRLAEELADVVICADLIAMDQGIDLMGEAVPAKFNATSAKLDLATRLIATAASPAACIRITRPFAGRSILAASGETGLAIRAGTVVHIGATDHTFHDDVSIPLTNLVAGTDYGIALDQDGEPFARPLGAFSEIGSTWFAGFHFAPGGNALGKAGGDAVPAINPFSLWDLDFRPSCPDPRGMALVDVGDKSIWVDIYLLGVNHAVDGTSRHGAKIADGNSIVRLDYAAAKAIVAEHGKRLLTYDEFRAAAHGVTEKSATPRDPDQTGLDPARTSRFGLMQATGNLWVWGADGDEDDPRPSLFGGSWFSGSDAGSRYANLGSRWPELSNELVSCRAACDHLNPV